MESIPKEVKENIYSYLKNTIHLFCKKCMIISDYAHPIELCTPDYHISYLTGKKKSTAKYQRKLAIKQVLRCFNCNSDRHICGVYCSYCKTHNSEYVSIPEDERHGVYLPTILSTKTCIECVCATSYLEHMSDTIYDKNNQLHHVPELGNVTILNDTNGIRFKTHRNDIVVLRDFYPNLEVVITYEKTTTEHDGYCSDPENVTEEVSNVKYSYPILKNIVLDKIVPKNKVSMQEAIGTYYRWGFVGSHGDAWCCPAGDSYDVIDYIVQAKI